MYKNKLIVIRGNSGSGKSIVTKKILEKFPNRKIAYIEQDNIRRNILHEKGSTSGLNDIVDFIIKEAKLNNV